MRVRQRWFNQNKTRTIEDNAGVIAFHIWKIAVERIKMMEGERFYIDLPERTLAVMIEYFAFLIHLVDRRSFHLFDSEQRARFVSAMANKLADIVDDNYRDAKIANYNRQNVIAIFNTRFGEYAEMPMDDDQPSYTMVRYLGHAVAEVLGAEHQKWVVERVIDIDAPAAVEILNRALGRFLVEDK